MSINSRTKGKNGELEWARFCRDHGYDCRRTAQYCGKTGDAADVVGLPGIHVEVKRVERLDLYAAIAQAERDAENGGEGKKPIVAHRKNNRKWLVTMAADKWVELYSAADAINDLVKRLVGYASSKLEEAAKHDYEVDIDYWRGYLDGVKAVQRDVKQ